MLVFRHFTVRYRGVTTRQNGLFEYKFEDHFECRDKVAVNAIGDSQPRRTKKCLHACVMLHCVEDAHSLPCAHMIGM